MNILILIFGVTAVIPEFKSGTYNQLDYSIENHILYSSSVPGRSDTRTIAFGYTFRDIPKVAIAIHSYDFFAGLPFGCTIEVISTTKTEFAFKATEYTGKTWYSLPIDWYAFNDESIEVVEFKLEPKIFIGNQIVPKTQKLANSGILILSGFYYTKQPDFYAEIIDVTETDFTVQLTDPNACLTWVTYQAVLGNLLNVWFQGVQKIVPIFFSQQIPYTNTLQLPDAWVPLQKFVIMGVNGFSESPVNNFRISFRYQQVENRVDFSVITWADTIFYEVRLQVLVYRLLEFEQSCVTISLEKLPHVIIDAF